MDRQAQALEAFHRVCANESFNSARDMFPDLARSVRALTTDYVFGQALSRALDQYNHPQKVRAEYLILLLRGRMTARVGELWDKWLASHPVVAANANENLTFFHGDSLSPGSSGNDEVAKLVGLKKGVDTGKLLQLLRHGIA